MKFIFTDIFRDELKKHVQNKPNMKIRVNECISDFQAKLFDSRYYRKSLKGYETEDVHELQVGGDPRIFIQLFRKDDECYFLNFWTHSSLELSSKKRLKINLIRKRHSN